MRTLAFAGLVLGALGVAVARSLLNALADIDDVEL